MNRRHFLKKASWGSFCGAVTVAIASNDEGWHPPTRFIRPDISTDEGGLWAMLDREETKLRRSPFIIRDESLQSYVTGIACRLAGDHCPDIRVRLVRNKLFNANMTPNGMLQVWSGLLLRIDNEAQLAAVLGHEIAHYFEKHGVDRLRDLKARSAFGHLLGMFGLVGLVGQVAALASMFAYSRDQERQADRIGLTLMSKAGYDPAEASKVWENLLVEANAKTDANTSPMFAMHPPMNERKEALTHLAAQLPKGEIYEQRWQEKTANYRCEWLDDEIKRGQFEESIALLSRLIVRSPSQSDFFYARAETYRMRAKDEDFDTAINDYMAAIRLGDEPPETHRGLGMIYRQRNQFQEAKVCFEKYLKLAPQAADYSIIKSYSEEPSA